MRPRAQGASLDALRRRIARTGGVAYAEPDYLQFASAAKVPDDPRYPQQYALLDSLAGHDVSAPEAWTTRTAARGSRSSTPASTPTTRISPATSTRATTSPTTARTTTATAASPSSLKDAVGHAQKHNVLLVVAAGNDGDDL